MNAPKARIPVHTVYALPSGSVRLDIAVDSANRHFQSASYIVGCAEPAPTQQLYDVKKGAQRGASPPPPLDVHAISFPALGGQQRLNHSKAAQILHLPARQRL